MNESKETLIFSIEKTELEEVRVYLSEYRDQQYFQIRIWYKRKDGFTPTQKGVILPINALESFYKGIAKLMSVVNS